LEFLSDAVLVRIVFFFQYTKKTTICTAFYVPSLSKRNNNNPQKNRRAEARLFEKL